MAGEITERKKCSQCGYANRVTAKVCANCGYRFVRGDSVLRKYCTHCGQANRIRARVCIQCGKALSLGKTLKQKWCPQCGTGRRPTAKVCTNCGHRFKVTEPPIVPFTDPPVTLPPQFDAPIPLPPPSSHSQAVPDLDGEPAPYISNDDINRLRGAGVYSPNVFARTINRLTKKGKS